MRHRQVILPAIEQLIVGSIERLQRIADAVDALISPDPVRREFLGHERSRHHALRRGEARPGRAGVRRGMLPAWARLRRPFGRSSIRVRTDISAVMGDIGELLDESITGIAIREEGPPPLDLSRINFEVLANRFKESKRKNTDLEVLKAAIRAQLEKLHSAEQDPRRLRRTGSRS